MKALSILLLLALGMGAAWWKVENPTATVDDARAQAMGLLQRLDGGVVAIRDGVTGDAGMSGVQSVGSGSVGAGADPDYVAQLVARLESLEKTLAEAGRNDQTRLQANADAATEAATSAATQAATDAAIEAATSAATQAATESATNAATAAATDAATESATSAATQAATDAATEAATSAATAAATDAATRAATTAANDAAAQTTAAAIQAANTAASPDAASAAPDPSTVERLDELDKRLSELASRQEERSADLISAERIDQLVDERIATALAQQRADASSRAARGNEKSDIEPRLAALENRMTRLAEASGSLTLDELQADLRQEIAALEARIGSDAELPSTTDVDGEQVANADRYAELDATRARLEALEARVQALPETSAAAENAQATQDALKAQISALEERLESMPIAPDAELASSISEVREQVDALNNSGFVTEDELTARIEGKNIVYKIYFDRNSIEIAPDAKEVLDSFIAQEKNRMTGVSIFGFTDRRGDADYNQRLALERATAVRSYLIQSGLDYTKIRAMTGFGEDAAAAYQPDDEEDAQQRVVVLYAQQP